MYGLRQQPFNVKGFSDSRAPWRTLRLTRAAVRLLFPSLLLLIADLFRDIPMDRKIISPAVTFQSTDVFAFNWMDALSRRRSPCTHVWSCSISSFERRACGCNLRYLGSGIR